MKRILYILLGVFTIASCQEKAFLEHGDGECVLELDVTRADMPIVMSRAVDADLAVSIVDANGQLRAYYSPGNVPERLAWYPGDFTVYVYSENQETWHTANDGKGEACYFATQHVVLEHDDFRRVSLAVPATNYAVGIELPEMFDELFASYQFVLKSGDRELSIHEGEKVYFDVSDGGFSYTFSATNIEGHTFAHSSKILDDVQSGKLYLISYLYGPDEMLSEAEVNISDNLLQW